MPTLSSSVPHASLLLALQLSARPLNERELAAITGLPEIRVRSALRELSLQKHVAAAPAEGSPDGGSGAPAWAITRIEPDSAGRHGRNPVQHLSGYGRPLSHGRTRRRRYTGRLRNRGPLHRRPPQGQRTSRIRLFRDGRAVPAPLGARIWTTQARKAGGTPNSYLWFRACVFFHITTSSSPRNSPRSPTRSRPVTTANASCP